MIEMQLLFGEFLNDIKSNQFIKLTNKVKSLQSDVLKIYVNSSEENQFYDDEELPYTETIQLNKLMFNDVAVYEWSNNYHGYYGSGGTGWWVDEAESSLKLEVHKLIELLEIEVKPPKVPKPPIDDAE